MENSVVLRVDNNVTYIDGRLESGTYQHLRKELGYLPENSFWMIKNFQDETEDKNKNPNWKSQWDGHISTVCWNKGTCHCNIKKSGTHFPTGLLSKAISIFKAFGVKYILQDIRTNFTKCSNYSMSSDFELRDYQLDIINKVVGNNGYKGIDRGIIKAATGSGKCVSIESLCLTEDGMIEIGEIEEGMSDEEYREKKINVYTPLCENGKDSSSYIYRDGVKESIKVTTSYGYSLTGTPNHRIIVVGDNGDFEWKRLDEITDSDIIVLSKNQNMFGKNNEWTIEEAYFMGLLYGDGCLNNKNSIRITTADNHIEEYVSAYASKIGLNTIIYYDKRTKDTRSVNINNKEYRTFLKGKGINYCLSHTKKIPLSIRTSSKSIVAAFLRGIYETDGCVEVDEKKMSITLGLSNERIIDQIHYILLNMGIVSSKRKKKTTHKDCFILSIYRDFIKNFIDTIGFDPEGYKRERSYKYYSDFIYRDNNSNKYLIYNQSSNIREIRFIIKDILGSKKYRNIIEEESGVKINVIRSWSDKSHWRNPSRGSLLSFLKWAEYRFVTKKEGITHHKYNRLKNLIIKLLEIVDDKYYYDKVKSIDKCTSNNYDFVIPKTHSFVSNGMINHNTALASAIIAGISVSPTIFYVPSIELLQQAKSEIEKFVKYNGGDLSVGIIGGGKKDVKDINVMTIQTAVNALGGVWKKYDDEDNGFDETDISDRKEEIRELIKSAKLIICDEIQHWASETCQIISDCSISARYRYGLSATPYRDCGDDILIDACFGRVIADINASFLIKRGYLVRPTIYFSPMSRLPGMAESSYATLYKKAIVENTERNSKIMVMANEFRNREKKILILVKQIAHGTILERLIPDSVFLHGSTSKKKRLGHLEKMRDGKSSITIASVIFDEGVDVRPLDTLILAGSGKSPTRALQRIGRILRPCAGKTEALAVDFMDQCKYLKKHSLKRLSIYETEEEFNIVGVKK